MKYKSSGFRDDPVQCVSTSICRPEVYRVRQYLFIAYVGAIFYAFGIFLPSVCLRFPLSVLTRDPISLHNLTTILCNLKCVILHIILRKRRRFLFYFTFLRVSHIALPT